MKSHALTMKLFTFLPSFSLWRYLGLGLVAVGIAACGGSGSSKMEFSAQLSGAQEVPAVTSAAQGSGTLTLATDTRELFGQINFTGMTATAAHIHVGNVGSIGGVIVGLTQGTFGTFVVPSNTVLTAAQVTELESGRYYFNVHSTAFPGGEIRGQITKK